MKGQSLILSALLLSSIALSNDAQAAEGAYIGNGSFRVSPQIGASFERRSNLLLTNPDITNVSGTALLLNPVLKLKHNTTNMSSMFGVSYKYRRYLTLGEVDLSSLNRWQDVQMLSSFNLFPDKKLGLMFDDTFSIAGRETTATSEIESQTDGAYIQSLNNKASLSLSFRPGSILRLNAGGSYAVNILQNTSEVANNEADVVPALNSKRTYGAYFDGNWKFFPKTTLAMKWSRYNFDWYNNILTSSSNCYDPLLAEATPEFGNPNDEVVDTDDDGESDSVCYVGIPDGVSSTFQVSLSGQFTNNLLLKFLVGSSSTKYGTTEDLEEVSQAILNLNNSVTDSSGLTNDEEEEYRIGSYYEQQIINASKVGVNTLDGLLVEFGATYFPTEKQQFSFGYTRGNADAFFTNYTIFREALFRYIWKPSVKLSVNNFVKARLDFYNGGVTRSDLQLTLAVDGTYNVSNRLNLTLGSNWRTLQSVTLNDVEKVESIEFSDLSIHGGLVWGY
ncbi:MAG: hypothetical protein CMK59_12270 [Proteobacteria bacterium]|nr:hypothetical protein [Pseudomonadota bacterium]